MKKPETSTMEAGECADVTKGFWTVDRIVIYSILAVAVVAAVNDYRLRSQWESDFEDLQLAVTRANTPGLLNKSDADSTLVKSVRSGVGVGGWLAERGYEVDDLRSSNSELVYFTSSGIRTFFINVDVRREFNQSEEIERTILVSRSNCYLWNQSSEIENKTIASAESAGEGYRGGQQVANSGGSERQRSGGGRGRSIDPEQIFSDRDEDMDGLLTGDEISERIQPALKEIDKDADGIISKDEFLKAFAAMMALRQQGGAGGGGEAGMMDLPDDPYEQGELGFPDANALPEDIEKLKKKLDADQ